MSWEPQVSLRTADGPRSGSSLPQSPRCLPGMGPHLVLSRFLSPTSGVAKPGDQDEWTQDAGGTSSSKDTESFPTAFINPTA